MPHAKTIFSIPQLFRFIIPFLLLPPEILQNFKFPTFLNNWESTGVKKKLRDAYTGLRDSKKKLVHLYQ